MVVVSRRSLPQVATTDQAVQTDPNNRGRRRKGTKKNQPATGQIKHENPPVTDNILSNNAIHEVTGDCQTGDDESHSSDKNVWVDLEDNAKNVENLEELATNQENNSENENALSSIQEPGSTPSSDKDDQEHLKHTKPREYVYLGEFEPTVEEITSL